MPGSDCLDFNEAAKLFQNEQEKDVIPMVEFLLRDLPQQRLPSVALRRWGPPGLCYNCEERYGNNLGKL